MMCEGEEHVERPLGFLNQKARPHLILIDFEEPCQAFSIGSPSAHRACPLPFPPELQKDSALAKIFPFLNSIVTGIMIDHVNSLDFQSRVSLLLKVPLEFKAISLPLVACAIIGIILVLYRVFSFIRLFFSLFILSGRPVSSLSAPKTTIAHSYPK